MKLFRLVLTPAVLLMATLCLSGCGGEPEEEPEEELTPQQRHRLAWQNYMLLQNKDVETDEGREILAKLIRYATLSLPTYELNSGFAGGLKVWISRCVTSKDGSKFAVKLDTRAGDGIIIVYDAVLNKRLAWSENYRNYNLLFFSNDNISLILEKRDENEERIAVNSTTLEPVPMPADVTSSTQGKGALTEMNGIRAVPWPYNAHDGSCSHVLLLSTTTGKLITPPLALPDGQWSYGFTISDDGSRLYALPEDDSDEHIIVIWNLPPQFNTH